MNRAATPAATRVATTAGAHVLVVVGLMSAFGYPLGAASLDAAVAGAAGVAGLALLGGIPRWLHARWGLRAPAAVAVVGLIAAVAAELALPGPTIAWLDAERVTVGVPVLHRYVSSWPLLLAVVALVGLTEHRLRRTGRPRWSVALRTAATCGLGVACLVLLSAGADGTWDVPTLTVAWGGPALALFGFVASLQLVRARLVVPAVGLGAALTVAAVSSWVQQVGDPVAGLLLWAAWYLLLALLLGVVELAIRAVVRRTRRTGLAGAGDDPVPAHTV